MAEVDTIIESINCPFTFNFCAAASLDAICCLTCCNFCGGCCGRYEPFTAIVMDEKMHGVKMQPGIEIFQATCFAQCIACMIMPASFCGCCWACCGIATPCMKCVVGCVQNVEHTNNKIAIQPPNNIIMNR